MEDEGLSKEEAQFFDTGGKETIPDDPAVMGTQPPKTEEVPANTETKAEPEKKEESKPEKLVPLAALHEAREQIKALKGETAAEKAERQKLEARFQALVQKLEKASEPQPPSYDEDPLAHTKAELDALKKKIDTTEQSLQERKQAETNQQQYNQFVELVSGKEAEFAKTNTDYYEALDHFRQIRAQDLRDLGVPEDNIAKAVKDESRVIAMAALRSGKDPAQAAYSIAKRYGFKSSQAKAEDSKTQNDQKIETITRGQEAAKTLSAGKADPNLTLESLANLSDEDLDELIQDKKWWKKNISKGL